MVGENLEPLLKIGDLLTVSGRVKASYNNDKSVTINYLKLIDLVSLAGQLPQKDYAHNPGDCITVYDSTDERIATLHKALNYGRLGGRKELGETLEKGHAFAIPLSFLENIKDSDPDGFWYKQLTKNQLAFCLGCWLGNRREKPVIVIKKKVTASAN